MNEVSVALISGILGFLASTVTMFLKFRKDLEAKYDLDLRARRIVAYKELWKHLQPLAKYSPPGPVTHQTLQNLSENLRQWYFEEGGLFLSESSRDSYFALQDEIRGLFRNSDQLEGKPLAEPIYELVRSKSSALRTALTRDVGTRKGSQISED